MAEDTQLTEDAMRMALERLSARNPDSEKNPRSGRPAPAATLTGRPSASTSGGSSSSAPRRRRFVGEGSVMVEHQILSRGRGPAQSRPAAPSDEQAETERLRQALRREQRRVHDGQLEIENLQARLHSLETGIGHLRIEVKELTDKIAEKDQEILHLKVSQEKAAQAQASAMPPVAKRPVGRPPKNPSPQRELASVAQENSLEKAAPKASVSKTVVEEEAQEPVQWWRD